MALTPYDKKPGIWHWKGSSVAEQTIEALARTIRKWAPHVKMVFVKTSDGSDWMGKYDSGQLAINGPEDVARWVEVLASNGLEFHAWCVPKGRDVNAEADIIIETCAVDGVKSMVLDIEPYAGFWEVGREPIRPFIQRVRRGIGGGFHLGMSVDPRQQHYARIFPDAWRPYVNSIHPQCYWVSFERDFQEVLDEAYRVWGNYGVPVIPLLQANADPDELSQARQYVVGFHNALALNWWRFGLIGPAQFPIVNIPLTRIESPQEPEPPQGGHYGAEIVVTPDDPGYRMGTHSNQPINDVTERFDSALGWPILYKTTRSDASSVWALWDPNLTESGWYEVATFVSARYATATRARYKLHGVTGVNGEVQVEIDQSDYDNLWVPLGIFRFDANNAQAGIVFLNDLTFEDDRIIGFHAMRYRRIIDANEELLQNGGRTYLADGYDAPIGTRELRQSDDIWPGDWFDATGFAVRYFRGTPQEAYHTGADLNLNRPYWDADANAPVFAVASGVVSFAGRIAGWGNVIVIRHDPLVSTGQEMYSRYAHVTKMRVELGDRVQRGQQIANVGNAEGAFPYHLHFDLSPTNTNLQPPNILESKPYHWPRLNLQELQQRYVDPREFIAENRPPRGIRG
jgi:murein DD-endopeptidase MepM/ murein hydrolase activator NlpD